MSSNSNSSWSRERDPSVHNPWEHCAILPNGIPRSAPIDIPGAAERLLRESQQQARPAPYYNPRWERRWAPPAPILGGMTTEEFQRAMAGLSLGPSAVDMAPLPADSPPEPPRGRTRHRDTPVRRHAHDPSPHAVRSPGLLTLGLIRPIGRSSSAPASIASRSPTTTGASRRTQNQGQDNEAELATAAAAAPTAAEAAATREREVAEFLHVQRIYAYGSDLSLYFPRGSQARAEHDAAAPRQG